MVGSYYEILGVSRNSEPTVIEAAYRAMMKRYHPDARSGTSNDRSAEINEAYSVLRNPAKRAAYDARLDQKHRSTPADAKCLATSDPDTETSREQRRTDKKRCPRCAELIQPQALVCRFCGATFSVPAAEQPSAFIEFWRKRTRWWDWVIFGIIGFGLVAAYAGRTIVAEDQGSSALGNDTERSTAGANRAESSSRNEGVAQAVSRAGDKDAELDEYLSGGFGTRVLWRADSTIQKIAFYQGEQSKLLDGCEPRAAQPVAVLSVDEEQESFRGQSPDGVSTYNVDFDQAPEVVGSWIQQMIQEGAVLKVSSAGCGASGSMIVVTALERPAS